MKKIVIAIDGPASSGKSTVADAVADKLNILHLNTGSLYRSIALFCLNNNISFNDETSIKNNLNKCDIQIRFENGIQQDYLNNKLVTHFLRTDDISKGSSVVSQFKCVRQKVLNLQRDIADKLSVVMEGRDITSEVLPNADYKFFITASAEERAKRRYKENLSMGLSCDYQTILDEIKERDYRDYNRKISPLKIVDDAFVIDTTDMTIEQVVEKVLKKIKIN